MESLKERLYKRSNEISCLLSVEDNPKLAAEQVEINRRLFALAQEEFAIKQEARSLGFAD